jgi:hypothetical protein
MRTGRRCFRRSWNDVKQEIETDSWLKRKAEEAEPYTRPQKTASPSHICLC